MKFLKYAHEIMAVVHQQCAADFEGRDHLEVCQVFNRVMLEVCARHKREIEWLITNETTPVVHEGSAVVTMKVE